MRLDRNINPDGKGKYALILLRKLTEPPEKTVRNGEYCFLIPVNAIDFGIGEDDFFVIRLKDKFAHEALLSYAMAVGHEDPEYALEVTNLANQALTNSQKKMPD